MAIAATALVGNADAANATSYATASITPTANRLVLAAIGSSQGGSGATAVPTLSGNGVTWVQVATVQSGDASTGRRVTLFRARHASPSAGAVTIDFGGVAQTRCAWSIVEWSDIDTSGTNGSGAIVQAVTAFALTGTAGTATLAAFGDATNNAAYSAITTSGGASNPITPEGGYTELHQVQPTAEAQRLETMWQLGGADLTPAPSWAVSLEWAQIAVEIKAASSAVTGTIGVTQDDQTAAMSGTVANPITGTIGVTQANQIANFSGTVTNPFVPPVPGSDTNRMGGAGAIRKPPRSR